MPSKSTSFRIWSIACLLIGLRGLEEVGAVHPELRPVVAVISIPIVALIIWLILLEAGVRV